MKKLLLVLLAVGLFGGLTATDGDLRSAYFSDVYKNLLIVKNSAKLGLDSGLEKLTDGYGNESKFLISAGASQTDEIAISLDTKYKFSWRDNGLVMYSSADGQLDIDADTELELGVGKFDVNATDDVTIDCSDNTKTIQIGETSGTAINIGHTTSQVTINDDIDVTGDIDVDGDTILDNFRSDGTITSAGTTIDIDMTDDIDIDTNDTVGGIALGTANSGVPISIGHTTSETTVNDNLTVIGTSRLTGAVILSSTLATGGKFTAGANEIEGSDFDINGGDISSTSISGSTGSFTTLTTSSSSDFGGLCTFNGYNIILDNDEDTWIDGNTDDNISLHIGGNDELDIDINAIMPSTDGGQDLGRNGTNEFGSVYLKQDVDCEDDLVVGDDATITGNLSVASMSTIDAFNYAGSDSGTDAYTATLTPALGSYITGGMIILNVTTANTGASTLNLNGLGAKDIKTVSGADPANDDILTTGISILVYDGTNFVLINPATTCD